jgi:hypothetical protein
MSETTEILELSTIAVHDWTTIKTKKYPKGKRFEFANLDDLSPFQFRRLITLQADADKLLNADKKLTEVQERKLHGALGEIAKVIVPSLDKVTLGELSTTQRLMISVAWSNRAGEKSGGADPKNPT